MKLTFSAGILLGIVMATIIIGTVWGDKSVQDIIFGLCYGIMASSIFVILARGHPE